MKVVNIALDFGVSPGGRFPEDGEYNGQRFREKFLIPALEDSEIVKVVLDGVSGFGSSFLEEAFGGLVRIHHYEKSKLLERLHLQYSDSSLAFYADSIRDFINDAEPE
ncbi:MAG: STAS-like domain-containing protein [Lysobacteraceae bacterium]